MLLPVVLIETSNHYRLFSNITNSVRLCQELIFYANQSLPLTTICSQRFIRVCTVPGPLGTKAKEKGLAQSLVLLLEEVLL